MKETITEYLEEKNLDKILIFLNTKRTVDFIAVYLSNVLEIACMTMHGDRNQEERELALSSFHKGITPILVATDVCARGIDVQNVGLVINYDAPHDVDDYVHR